MLRAGIEPRHAQFLLLLDEYMRFLNKGIGAPTESILDVGVQRALEHLYWDQDSFYERGGIYDWSREADGCASKPELEF